MKDDRAREQEVFSEALDKPADERAAYLDVACGDDAGFRAQIESLLDAMERAGEHGFFDRPTGGASGGYSDLEGADPVAGEEQPGALIGVYEILDQIGSGGFGRVYRARQTEPIRRVVALKVIKLGMDTRQVVARFEAERQALAMMDHPSIATVFDAGATASGRPYFVMEYVDGLAITRFCDQHRMGLRDRLELFREVCSAIQHAHQKGVIHRDIKPSNVLVAGRDGGSVRTKVIDFGVAKATAVRLTDETIHTEARQLVGTPTYMSPEQAGLTRDDVDTRSDVYSLGVLLYELLSGVNPVRASESSGSDCEDIQRSIREVTPPKPSTRIAAGEDSESIALLRGTDSAGLWREIRGDLDWIVMKAIEKERGRRYQTVEAFSEDIARYLTNEPIEARPPSKSYRLKKFAQRNKGAVSGGIAVVAVLLLGVAGTTAGMVWALEERDRASQAAVEESLAQARATDAAERARAEAERAAREAETAEELSRFFVMDVLSAADPARTENRELTVREALVNASASIEGRFEGRPDFESKIHNALGYLFGRLGVLDRAEHHHRRELALTEQEFGEESYEAARIMHSVVGDLAMQERDAEAIELTRRQLAIVDRLDHPEAPRLRLRVIGNLGALLIRTGRFAEAIPTLEETLVVKRREFGDRHPTTISTIEALSAAAGRTGEYGRALELAEEAYAAHADVLGIGDARTLNTLASLAVANGRVGEHEIARELLEDGVADAVERLGIEHPTTIALRANLAGALFDGGHIDRAEAESRSLIVDLGRSDPDMMSQQSRSALLVLSRCLLRREEAGRALDFGERALESARAAFGGEDVRLADFLVHRAEILGGLGRFEAAESDLKQAWRCVDRDGVIRDQSEPVMRAFVGLYERWYASEADVRYRDLMEMWTRRLGG